MVEPAMTSPDLADRLEKAIDAIKPSMNYGDRIEKQADLRNLLLDNLGEILAALRASDTSARETYAEWRDDAFGYPRRALYIGNAYVGSILYQPPQSLHYPDQWRGWFMHDDEGNETGWFATADEARKSVEMKIDPPRALAPPPPPLRRAIGEEEAGET